MTDAIGKGGADQFDDALIAVGEVTLVDGERQMARPQQARHGGFGLRRQAGGIELGVAAHGAGAGDIGHHQADGSVARRLQGEDALIFQGAG